MANMLQVHSGVDRARGARHRDTRGVLAALYHTLLQEYYEAGGPSHAQGGFQRTRSDCDRDPAASARLQQLCQGDLSFSFV
jgi:hypothetical protein